jgi:hypothetical protein
LYRYSKCFIAGSLATEKDGIVDCVAGAKVTLFQEEKKVADAVTDSYGDFKFDQLEAGSGNYVLAVEAAGYENKAVTVERLKTSTNLGTIMLASSEAKATTA